MTKRQNAALKFIGEYIVEHGLSPSIREIANALNLRAASGAQRLVEGLVAHGYVRRIHHRARSIELVIQVCPNCGHHLATEASVAASSQPAPARAGTA